MKNLESRVTKLESLIAQDDADSVRVIFPDDGETMEMARKRNGIADEFTGKVLAVSFVAAPSRSAPTRFTGDVY
jgi:hypothetical protein